MARPDESNSQMHPPGQRHERMASGDLDLRRDGDFAADHVPASEHTDRRGELHRGKVGGHQV